MQPVRDILCSLADFQMSVSIMMGNAPGPECVRLERKKEDN